MVLTASFGTYPRPDSLREYQIKTYGKQKKIDYEYSQADLDNLNQALEQVVADQEELGIITDGMLEWDDYLVHPASCFEGIKMGGLIRFYDNNMYYRRPAIVGEVKNEKPLLGEGLNRLKEINPGQEIKAVIPGPYSLYDLSEDKYYNDAGEAIAALSAALQVEVEALDADYIQIDEPSLSYTPDSDLFPLVNDELDKIIGKAKAKVIVTTYFGDSSRVMDQLADIKADYIGVDCVSFPQNYDALLDSGLKNVQLGVLDARNTKIEDETELRYKIDALESDDLILSTNCGLEFLSRQYAKRKLDLLSKLK